MDRVDGLEFCTVAFDTANHARQSACLAAMARVRDGQVVAIQSLTIRPPRGYDDFLPEQVERHGISWAMVRGRPRLPEVIGQIIEFAEELTFVGHGATWETGIIRAGLLATGTPWPTLRYACTQVLARSTWKLNPPWVSVVAAHVGYRVSDPEGTEATALAAAHIMNALARHYRASTIPELLDAAGYRMGMIGPGGWNGCTKIRRGSPSSQPREGPTESHG